LEDAMSYLARPHEFIPGHDGQPADRAGRPASRPGLLRRIYQAMHRSRQRQAERVVAAYLESTGGRFTDEIERRVTERLITGEWRR
jgi:hypothetical protein